MKMRRGTMMRLSFLGAVFISFVSVFQLFRIFVTTTSTDYICNPGVAFGAELPSPVFIVMWIVVMLLILYLWYDARPSKFTWHIPYVAILAGGVSNIIDRSVHGCVIDYLRIVPWNVFNLADTAIFMGVILIIVYNWKSQPISHKS